MKINYTFHFWREKARTVACLVLLFIFHFSFFISSSAQSPLVKQWDHRFGGTQEDIPYGSSEDCGQFLQPTPDGGYIIGGRTQSGAGGDKTQPSWGSDDFWVVKTDVNGVKQWDKRYGGSGWEELYCLITTMDGGYLFAGMSGSGISGDKSQNNFGINYDYWIIKTDSLGVKQWDKTYGGNQDDRCNFIQQTRDGGYVMCGWSSSPASGNKTQGVLGGTDYWIIKTDTAGNIVWQKDYGGNQSDFAQCVKQTRDGGYVVAGFSQSGVSGDKTGPKKAAGLGYDMWILRLDSLGTKLWDKDFGGTMNNYCSAVIENSDGTLLFCGRSNSGISGDKSQPVYGDYDIWLIKTDSVGNKLWDKDYGGTLEEEDVSISTTSDGNYIIAADSYSPTSGNISVGNLGTESWWVVKIDTAGTIKWEKSVNADHAEYANIYEDRNGCYIVGGGDNGGVINDRTENSRGGYDYWLIKFCDSTLSLPHASFTSSDTAFCGETERCIHFSDQSTGNPTSWQWLFPGAVPDTSTLQNPDSICYHNPGTYSVTLIVSNSSGTDTLIVSPHIIFSPLPAVPTITQAGDTLISSHASQYQWLLNGFPISAATDSFYVATQGGTYAVRITDSLGCSVSSGGVLITAAFSAIGGSGLRLFPNPVSDELILSFLPSPSIETGEELVITDIAGRLIAKEFFSEHKFRYMISTKDLCEGIYYLQFKQGLKVFREKFIVVHK